MARPPSLLFVFDFDHTLIDDNSDTVVFDVLAPPLGVELRALARSVQWTDLMDQMLGRQGAFVFVCGFLTPLSGRRLHAAGFGQEDVVRALHTVALDPALLDALRALHTSGYADLRIVSDANTVFIDAILRHHGAADFFARVVTNPVCRRAK